MNDEIKLRSAPDKTFNRRIHVMLNDQGDRDIREALLHYEILAGQSVSRSLIIRRGLRHLVKHLRNLTAQAEALDATEKAKLVESLTIKGVR